MSAIPDYYFPDQYEFRVGEAWWTPQVAISEYGDGAALASPTAAVRRVSDGADVTPVFWPGAGGAITATHVQWSAFTMAAAGEYEIGLSVQVNGKLRTDVQRVRVFT